MFNSRDQNNESIDMYINDLRNLARNCNFCECLHDSLLRDRLVMGIRDKSTRKKLLQITNLTLQQTVDICRAAEATDERLESLKCEDIHSIRLARNVTKSYRDKHVNSSDEIECLFCGRRHARLKSKCPAWGKTCSKCSKRNHFAIKCRNSDDRNVHAVNEVDSDIESINTVHAVDKGGHQIYGEVNINDFPVRIQIDSGATVNVIPKRYIGDNHVTPTSTVLQMWNKTRVIPVGEAKVELENPAKNKRYRVKFIVVNDDSGLAPLLGSKASQRMNIITINTNNLKQVATVASTSVLDSFGDVLVMNWVRCPVLRTSKLTAALLQS